MAKRYIKQLLSQKLGEFLEGLDSTDVKFSVKEAQLQMENVRIKDDALTKLKLPIQIKHGQIRKLDLRVPWFKITSSPVEITLEGVDLLLTPLSSDLWEVSDIFEPEYLAATIEAFIKTAIEKQATNQQQSYMDTFKLKILDNLVVKIKDIQIRIEHQFEQQKSSEIKQSSFGILLNSLELHTTDAEGRQIFYDRASNKNLFKLLSIDGLAVYLNPYDATMIHKLPFKVIGKGNHIGSMMRKCIQQYIQFTSTKEGEIPVGDDPNLIYILRPLSLKVHVERQAKLSQMLNVQITLDQFSIQLLYNQLKAILVFARLAQLYQKKYGEQEKIRKYQFLKQPAMKAKQRWQFAIECILRSIKTKKGALTAFNIPKKLLMEIEKDFKPLLTTYYHLPENDRFNLIKGGWSQQDQNRFWYAIQSVPASLLKQWVLEVVKQIQNAKKQKDPQAASQSWMGWLMGSKSEDVEDNLDEFFDADDGETVLDRNTVRENTSLSVVFEVKELILLIAKLNNQNRFDGIQMYNKATRFELTSPDLNLNRFKLNATFQESGVDLVSIDRETSKYVECTSTFKKNDLITVPGVDNSPQLALEIIKGDPLLIKQGIQYDINLQIISVVYKHYEELIIRAWAISSIQVDEEIQAAAKGTFEDLRENTQNRLQELIYKKRNRFVISIQSPVIILPVRGVYENSPVWVIRTGDMLIISEDTRKLNAQLTQKKVIGRLSKKRSSEGQDDEFDGYRFTLTSAGLQYFHQYEFYQKFLLKQSSKTLFKKQEQIMPPRHHDFTLQQNTLLQQREPTHSINQFSVLEDFEIKMLLRLKKNKKIKETNTAQVIVEMQTSPIQINLSVTFYNLLLNMPKIFTISKAKREDFEKEVQDFNSLQRQGVQKNAICEGLVKKQHPRTLLWEDFYAVLSGKFVYLYKEKTSQEYLEYFDISNVDISEQGSQIIVSSQLDLNISVVFRSVDGQQKVWTTSIEKRTFDLQIDEYQQSEQVEIMINKRKTILKKKAQTFSDSQNCEQIKLKFSCIVPQLKVMILRLVLMPETRVFVKPLIYQEWVTFAMIGCEIYRVSRELDSQLQIQFNQITLTNDTLPYSIRTLLSQEQSKTQAANNQNQKSLTVTINVQKQNSPLFEGLLEEMNVELSNVNLKFMPDTLNQLIKLLKSTKQQKSHTEEFISQEEFRLFYQQSDVVDENNTSNTSYQSIQLITDQKDEEVTSAVQTQKFFETTCNINKTQKGKISVQMTNVKMAMLHHQYAMELFSLDTSSLSIQISDFYDHSSFDVQMVNLILNDLTNYPYTKSPKAFFDAISKNLQPEPITSNELIKCNSFEMNLQSYDSPRCPHKKRNFASQLFMKISPFKINYVGEITMRLIEYFQERFISTFVLADPYKNPKQEFEKLQKLKNIPSDRITSQTNFEQPTEITYMDITIQKAEIFARDRPFSSSYILISTPVIKVQSELIKKTGRIFLKPEIPLAIQRYKIEIQTLNFLYGASKNRRDRLSLLKKTFTVKLDFDTVAYSNFIDKIDQNTMDKSSHISIKIDPVMLVLPQAVYTYILRCSDLNFAWTDQMGSEFYFIKWKHISDHHKQLRKVSSQKLSIEISMLSLTLKHTDGSYISELLLSGFDLFMLKFMDGASNIDIKCNRFFILDQKDQSSQSSVSKQAVVCPTFSPMIVNLETEMQDVAAGVNISDHDAQLVVQMKMRPTGRKSIIVTIQGLKIFVKLPLFILLQNFFTQAFPQYNDNDIDKPVGFVGNDPDNTGCMHLDVKIHKSLICVLNRPGLKSLAFQGDIRYGFKSENISKVKANFHNLSSQTIDTINSTKSFVSQDPTSSPVVYSVLLEVIGLTPYICSLSYLDQGDVDFSSINKRQLHNPLNLSMDQKYILTPQLNDHQEETEKFGVTIQNVINVKQLMLKLSILDLHLIIQATAFMSEQMAEETVQRLRNIEQSIDRDFIQNQQQDDDVPQILEEEKHDFRNMVSPNNAKKITLTKRVRETLTDEQRMQAKNQKQQMFEGMINRFKESNDDNMSTVMQRFSQTTSQFQKLSKGYTSQTYQERGSFLQFIKKDILMQQDEADIHIVQDEGPLQKITGMTVGFIQEIEKDYSSSEEVYNQGEEQKATTQGDSSLKMMQKNQRTQELLGGVEVDDLYKSNYKSIYQSKSPQHSTLNRPENNQLGKFGSGPLLSSKSTKKQDSRVTPKGSVKSGRITPGYRSAKGSVKDQSDNEDDFKSARGSLDSYQDAVGEALDVFYSFHEKRPLPKAEETDDTNENDFYDVMVEPVNLSPRDTMIAGTEDQPENSFSDSLLRQMQKTDKLKKVEEQKSSLQNILNDVKEVRCELISVLAINDLNSGFTPVLQLEMSSILMNQNWVQENTDTAVELPALLINYYNLELGEWEPLLERTQVNFLQTTSKTQNVTTINFKESICLNSTEQCLKNLFHTYKSWMQTPHFFQNSKNSKTLQNHNSSSMMNSAVVKHSLNVDDDDNLSEVHHRQIYNSIRESVLVKKDQLIQSGRQNKPRDLMHEAIEIDDDSECRLEQIANKNINELVTPFSIVNYTTRTIKIVRGGIKIGTGQFSEVKQFSSQLPKDLTENEKIYELAPRQSIDYAVTYDRLMGIQKEPQPGQDQPPDLNEFEQSDYARETINSEMEEDLQRDKLRKLKNNEIVGIQLSELDFVPSFDLNKNTGQNPWVHEISTKIESLSSSYNNKYFKNDIQQPLLQDNQHDFEDDQDLDTWEHRKIRNRVFYGTLIKDMRKFLIVRAPYCLVNKSQLNFEIKIIETIKKRLKSKFRVQKGEIMGLDQQFYRNHSIQVRIAKEAHHSGMSSQDQKEGWSDSVQISSLLNLQMNEGAGVYLTTFDGQSYCTCIKRQQGQLNGTADLVLLPVITINNCLPSCIQIRPFQQKASMRATNVSEDPIKPLYTEIYVLEQSQEKSFYTFSPTKYKDDHQVIVIEVLVQGFDWAPIELQVNDLATAEERDLEISDLNGNSVKIGLRIQYAKAGFHLVFYAHTCLLVESVLALPMMKICYKGGNFRQMKQLANSDELVFRKYLLCNKESDVVVGIMDVQGQARPTYSFSPILDIKQAGKQINFKIITQGAPDDEADTRYDFVCTPTLQLAHYQESIYTKLVLISPRYVIVNKTKGYLRIAQNMAQQFTAESEQIFTPGEKREWFWPNGEIPQSQLKIIIQKLQPRGETNSKVKSNGKLESLVQLDANFGKERSQNQRLSESDKVLNWNWSAPISLSDENQQSFPIVQSEQDGLKKKILIIGRKLVGSTTFITIRDEKQTDFPTYIIKNKCNNLRLGFSQDGQEKIIPWHLEELQQVSYAHIDPLALVRTLTFHMTIDKEIKKARFKVQNCFERVLEKVDIDTEETTLIEYTDSDAKPHQIEVKLTNDGQTKTLSFRTVGQINVEQVVQQNKQRLQLVPQATPDSNLENLMIVTINQFSLSLIGYTKRNIFDSIEKNYRPVRERNEIALFTIQGLELKKLSKNADTEEEIKLVIDRFQVDNQSSQNPLFQTIFKKKSSAPDVKFFSLDLKRQITKEKATSYIEYFKMELAKCTLKFDDEFLVNFSQAVTAAIQTNEDNSSGVHPLFMKENFYEKFDKFDLYLSTAQNDITDQDKSQTFVTAAVTERSQRTRQTLKPTQFGVYTIDELRCPQQNSQIPIAFKHWVMQDQIMEDSSKIYLKKFEISPISFDLSFVFKTKKGERQELTGPMNYLQSTGLTLVSIDEADFTIKVYKVQKKYIGYQDFLTELSVYFGEQALIEATKLPFSVGVIGSPRNLIKYAQIGITDFVELPRRGFERNWYSGIGGVALGSISMFKNFSIGTFQFAQGISHGLSNFCVLAVTDKDYAIKREDEHLTQKPQNFVEGVGYGAQSFLYSIYSAVIGVVSRPIIETRRLKSFKGFGKGVWQATSGLIGKPFSGTLDFFSKSSEGIKNTLKIFENYDDKKGGRIRQPRTLYGHQRQIKTFSEDDAFMVSNVLCTMKNGTFINDHYIDMRLIRTANENQTPHFLLWTEENLFLIEATQKALVWHIESKNINSVTNLNNGLMIYLDEKQDYAGRAQVGLPLDSEHQVNIRQWLDQIQKSNT